MFSVGKYSAPLPIKSGVVNPNNTPRLSPTTVHNTIFACNEMLFLVFVLMQFELYGL